MKQCLCSLLFLFALETQSIAQVKQLTSFSDLMRSLTSGHVVRVIISYARCILMTDGQKSPAPDAVGGMELKTFEYFAPGSVRNPKGFVTSSETVLISHRRYGYVNNYVKLRIFENDSVEVTARYLTPDSLHVVMDETFWGKISTNKDTLGVALFEQ